MFCKHCASHIHRLGKKGRKLTFAITYKEFKISSSSSVPKMAEICDMGLYRLRIRLLEAIAQFSHQGCHGSTWGPLRRNHDNKELGKARRNTNPVPLNAVPAAK